MATLFSHPLLHVALHESEIPWVKIFSAHPYKELSDCDASTKAALFTCMEICEKTLIDYYSPEKINIAMFGNYLPHLHIHVMARFTNDSYFPEPMWGTKQREGTLSLPPLEGFIERLKQGLLALG
jgi:diadenosine tetraphosphate (Ap4A) HIT family hydrolase